MKIFRITFEYKYDNTTKRDEENTLAHTPKEAVAFINKKHATLEEFKIVQVHKYKEKIENIYDEVHESNWRGVKVPRKVDEAIEIEEAEIEEIIEPVENVLSEEDLVVEEFTDEVEINAADYIVDEAFINNEVVEEETVEEDVFNEEVVSTTPVVETPVVEESFNTIEEIAEEIVDEITEAFEEEVIEEIEEEEDELEPISPYAGLSNDEIDALINEKLSQIAKFENLIETLKEEIEFIKSHKN